MRRSTIVALAACGLVATGGLAWADRHHRWGEGSATASLDPTYAKECGSCHMAFQPQFLPTRSWTALMNNLGSHFGENATLDDATSRAILTYLEANAGDAGGYGRYLRGLPASQTPLRITETPYWIREHQSEVRPAAFLDPKVKTKANCIACHAGAQQGIYEDND